jgi:hypothetical protein
MTKAGDVGEFCVSRLKSGLHHPKREISCGYCEGMTHFIRFFFFTLSVRLREAVTCL